MKLSRPSVALLPTMVSIGLVFSIVWLVTAWFGGSDRLDLLLGRQERALRAASVRVRTTDADAIRDGVRIFRAAVALDPASPYRWCDLGEALLDSGADEDARKSFARAEWLGSHLPPVLMRVASFHMRNNDAPRALDVMARILNATPEYDDLIFSYYDAMSLDLRAVLERGIPPSARSARAFLRHQLRAGPSDAMHIVWDWVASRGLTDTALAAVYVNFNLQHQEYDRALAVWVAQLGDLAGEYPHVNAIYNAGFEAAESGCRLDWAITSHPDVEVTRATGDTHTGGFALRLRFSGDENVDYHHTEQTAIVRGGRWRFHAFLRTEGVTTDRGIAFRLFDLEAPHRFDVRTSFVSGTAGWHRLEQDLVIPDGTRLLTVQLVRQPSEKFDSRIRGTVWVDDVSLTRADTR